MSGLRVVVDLSAYFLDHRQKSLIFIDRGIIKSVQNLISHICTIFSLDDNFEIFILDAHVPRSECVDIVQEGDIIRIENVTDLPDVNSTSLLHQKSKNNHKEIILGDSIIAPSEKKKKRKAPKDEAMGEGKLVPENVSESLSCCATLTSEPRKKKKKKTLNESQDGSSKTIHDSQAMKNESRKEKKKKLAHEPKELSQCSWSDNIAHDESNDLKAVLAIAAEILIEPDRVQTSSPIAPIKCIQLPTKEHENNSVVNANNPVDIPSAQIAEDSAHSSLLNESVGSNKVAIDSLCETYHSSISSFTVKKRRRQRKRNRPKTERHANTSILNVSKVLAYKPVHSSGGSVVPKIKRGVASNNHVRFSDEDEKEKVYEIPDTVEVCESMQGRIKSVDALEVKDPSISMLNGTEEDCTVGTTKEGMIKLPEETDVISADEDNEDRQKSDVCQGNEKNLAAGGLVISEDDKICAENGVKNESLVNNCEIDGIMSTTDNYDSNAHAKVESCEVSLFKPKSEPNILPKCKGNRRRTMIIAKGVGETLSQLLRGSNKPNEDVCILQNCIPSEPLVTFKKIPDSELVPAKKKDSNYEKFPILEKFPHKGDILAFKILKLNEKYEPTVSEHLEGKIMDCDNTNALVTVKVLGGANELKKTYGKFDLEEEVNDGTALFGKKHKQETLQLQWKEFIEPRLIFP